MDDEPRSISLAQVVGRSVVTMLSLTPISRPSMIDFLSSLWARFCASVAAVMICSPGSKDAQALHDVFAAMSCSEFLAAVATPRGLVHTGFMGKGIAVSGGGGMTRGMAGLDIFR